MAQAWHNLDSGLDSQVIAADCNLAVKMMADAGMQFDAVIGDPPFGVWPWKDGVLTLETWKNILRVMKPGAFMFVHGGAATYHRQTSLIEDAGFKIVDMLIWVHPGNQNKVWEASTAVHQELLGARAEVLPRSSSPDSVKWRGWGSRLLPIYEPILLAQKPSDRWMAGNLVHEGVGALNLNAPGNRGQMQLFYTGDSIPPNIVAEEEKAQEIADMFGRSKSRMFYCRNVSPAERNAGIEAEEGNDHTTVRPIKLERWLISLITPPGGLLLNPCCGSGSIGCAAMMEDVRYVGVDIDPHYIDIARQRIAWWRGKQELEKQGQIKKVRTTKIQPRVKIHVGHSVKQGGVCRNGHELTPGNVYERPDGRRECLTCKRLARHGVKSKDQ